MCVCGGGGGGRGRVGRGEGVQKHKLAEFAFVHYSPARESRRSLKMYVQPEPRSTTTD